jgi:hypothetical protein
MTGVSITLTKRTPSVLVIIDPHPCGFAREFKRFVHPFCQVVAIKANPILKLVFACKISPIVAMIPTLELRK